MLIGIVIWLNNWLEIKSCKADVALSMESLVSITNSHAGRSLLLQLWEQYPPALHEEAGPKTCCIMLN